MEAGFKFVRRGKMHRSLQIDIVRCGGDKSLLDDIKKDLEKTGKYEVIRNTMIYTIKVLKAGEKPGKDPLADNVLEKKIQDDISSDKVIESEELKERGEEDGQDGSVSETDEKVREE